MTSNRLPIMGALRRKSGRWTCSQKSVSGKDQTLQDRRPLNLRHPPSGVEPRAWLFYSGGIVASVFRDRTRPFSVGHPSFIRIRRMFIDDRKIKPEVARLLMILESNNRAYCSRTDQGLAGSDRLKEAAELIVKAEALLSRLAGFDSELASVLEGRITRVKEDPSCKKLFLNALCININAIELLEEIDRLVCSITQASSSIDGTKKESAESILVEIRKPRESLREVCKKRDEELKNHRKTFDSEKKALNQLSSKVTALLHSGIGQTMHVGGGRCLGDGRYHKVGHR